MFAPILAICYSAILCYPIKIDQEPAANASPQTVRMIRNTGNITNNRDVFICAGAHNNAIRLLSCRPQWPSYFVLISSSFEVEEEVFVAKCHAVISVCWLNLYQ
ncbi:hypothetical protein SFRURICE_001067 [Spodoptera frugiperda]|nr:hypothetical protein SFRURICE_001067 [Spodoptera frugiperda]